MSAAVPPAEMHLAGNLWAGVKQVTYQLAWCSICVSHSSALQHVLLSWCRRCSPSLQSHRALQPKSNVATTGGLQEDEEARSTGTTAALGRQGPIPVLSSPFGAAPAAVLSCSSPSGSMASSKESSLKETLRQQGQPLGAAAGSAGLMTSLPLSQGGDNVQQQRQMWR